MVSDLCGQHRITVPGGKGLATGALLSKQGWRSIGFRSCELLRGFWREVTR
jgi:hypothetical protein